MKCKHCDGDGVIVDVEYGHAGKYGCKYCDGKGVVEPLTNEEWLRTATTEQLAEILFQEYCNGRNDATTGDWEGVDTYVEWLKQPHNSPK